MNNELVCNFYTAKSVTVISYISGEHWKKDNWFIKCKISKNDIVDVCKNREQCSI